MPIQICKGSCACFGFTWVFEHKLVFPLTLNIPYWNGRNKIGYKWLSFAQVYMNNVPSAISILTIKMRDKDIFDKIFNSGLKYYVYAPVPV